MEIVELIAGSLAVWRLSSLIVRERGPFDIFVKLRELVGIEHFWPGAKKQNFEEGPEAIYSKGEPVFYPDSHLADFLRCIWCVSVWMAAPVALTQWWPDWFDIGLGWLAISAGAIIVDRIIE